MRHVTCRRAKYKQRQLRQSKIKNERHFVVFFLVAITVEEEREAKQVLAEAAVVVARRFVVLVAVVSSLIATTLHCCGTLDTQQIVQGEGRRGL